MKRTPKLHLLFAWCLLMVAPGTPWADDGPAAVAVEVCYGFGCRLSATVTFNGAEWESVAALLETSDADQERQQLKFVLGYLEYLAGRRSPIHLDRARNAQPGTGGQLDCIDESINATRFLEALEDSGLLRFHRVLGRAYRRSLVTQHWAAQVEDVATGRRFVYDTWFADNGRPSVLASSERWHDLWLGARRMNLRLAGLSEDQVGNNSNRK